jgi:hypothetical protein
VGIIESNFKNGHVNLYPNPNSGKFTFESNYSGKYSIVNNIGQVIFEFEMNSDKQEINLSKLSSGVYSISHLEGQIPPIKLVIQ